MRHSRALGFTLVELMVTIAIVGILLAIGLPSFQGSMRSNRVATTTNEMLASISLARTEAIRSTRPSVLCASGDGSVCGLDWNQGWIVWVDSNGDVVRNPGEPVVRYVQGHPQMALAVTTAGAASTTTVIFDNRGRPNNGGADRSFALQPSPCDAGQSLLRTMTLSGVGHVNTVPGSCP